MKELTPYILILISQQMDKSAATGQLNASGSFQAAKIIWSRLPSPQCRRHCHLIDVMRAKTSFCVSRRRERVLYTCFPWTRAPLAARGWV